MIRIRLQRRGRRKRPIYHIVVADSRAPRDGRIIEDLGRFDNVTLKNQVNLNQERAIHWIQKGAQPSDTVRSILKEQGILYRVHLMNWGKSEEEIEQALAEWREAREAKEDKAPTRKERQRALLEAEEKEYQKQLKKKAEEAARQKAKEEALAAEEEETEAGEAEAEVTTDTGEASEPEVQKEAEKEAADEGPSETESSDEEEEKKETAEEEAGTASEPEVQKEAEKEASEESTESADTGEEEENKKKTASDNTEAEEDEEASESGSQLSTDMTAKEAIEHINNTDVDDLDGFVPDDEDRVTVQRAWESKQEE